MSVLKERRTESKAQFINLAHDIYKETLQFLTRLSARYSRLLSADTIHLAFELLSHCEKANSIFPSDDVRKKLREEHLLEARASLLALDVQLSVCYETMMLNPQGCFTNSKGETLSEKDSIEKLDKMCVSLGTKIDEENEKLTNVLKSDKKR